MTSSENSTKEPSLATKSVSQLISTIKPIELTNWICKMPSAADLPAFLLALIPLDFLNSSMAWVISPLVSNKACLQSIIPIPVLSLSSFTREADISVI